MHCKYFDCQKCSFYLWHISYSCTTVLLAAMSCKSTKLVLPALQNHVESTVEKMAQVIPELRL